MFTFVTVLALINLPFNVAIPPTVADVQAAETTIIQIIIDNQQVGNRFIEFPFIAGFVRLAFHDCVGDGHCDGCVDHSVPDNRGLKIYTDKLDEKYPDHASKMSRADFYMLSSLVALEMATEHVVDKFTALADNKFLVGRADCANSPAEDETGTVFPKAEFDSVEMLNFFSTQFGFTPQEVVALMGAHTLGQARVQNSGFVGKWVRGTNNGTGIAKSDILNNEYFSQIPGGWVQVAITHNGVTKLQWQRPRIAANDPDNDRREDPNMLLNVDMALLWNISPVNENGGVECEIACGGQTCCPRVAATRATLRDYITDNSKWIFDFTDVFLKMINKNNAALASPIN